MSVPTLVCPPAFINRPLAVGSDVESIAGLAQLLGRPLDAEQRLAVETLTGRKANGRAASLLGIVICPRQNMKTWILQLIVLWRLLKPDGDKLVIWSAHKFDTAQETFRDFLALIEANPWLAELVERVDLSNGKDQITFAGGRRLRFRARTLTGGAGLTGDCVVLDEGFALVADHLAALLPILSTRKRALVLVGSSAGHAMSTVLRSWRDRGRKGGPGAPAYIEWCAPGSWRDPGCTDPDCLHVPGTPGCTLDRVDYLLKANPAAAIPSPRISMEYLSEERTTLASTPERYARERFGWWDEPAVDAVDLEVWATLVDAASAPRADRRPVLAVDVAPHQRSASVVLVGHRADGLVHVELLRRDAGIGWLGAFLRDKQRACRGDVVYAAGERAPVAAVVPTLEQAGVRLTALTGAEISAACQAMDELVTAGGLRHLGDPLISASLGAAVRKDVGDGAYVLSRKKSGGDITAAVALALALWRLAGQRAAEIVY